MWNKCAVLSLSKVASSPRLPEAELFCLRFITYIQKHLQTFHHEQDCHIHIESMNYGAQLWQAPPSITANICGINRHPCQQEFKFVFKGHCCCGGSGRLLRHSWDNFQCFHLHHWAGNSRGRWAGGITQSGMLSMEVKSSLSILIQFKPFMLLYPWTMERNSSLVPELINV